MGPLPETATLRDLVPLMYRADWAAVSLSATVTSWTDHALRIRVRDRGRRHAAPRLNHRAGACNGASADRGARCVAPSRSRAPR